MVDMKMQYQVVIFADLGAISPSPDNITTLVQAFRDKELIPSVFQEIRGGGISPRISLNSPNNDEWLISIGLNRLSIEKKPVRAKGENLGDLNNFCTESVDLLSRIIGNFKFKSNRLSLITRYLLEEMSPEILDGIFRKFVNPIPFFIEHEPFEWNWKAAAKSTLSFANLNERINALTTIIRGRGEIASQDGIIPFDRIQVLLDINTEAEGKDPRFELDHMREFYKQVTAVHDLLLDQIESSVHA